MIVYSTDEVAPDFRRYRDQWESALLSQALAALGQLAPEEQKALRRNWFVGIFNGHATHCIEAAIEGFQALDWRQAGPTQFDLLYTAPFGAQCALGRVYEQPDGSWGALVIAGVKDDLTEAMAAAEWAVTKLAS